MAVDWVLNEMRTVDLKDKRLEKRLAEVVSALGEHPTASIPAACGGHAEMTAAYRLFDNEKVTFDAVLAPHIEATLERIAAQSEVVVAEDTTEVDLTRPEQQVVGAGPLDAGPRRGAFLHPLHAFTLDGTPLGTVDAKVWAREEGDSRRSTMTPAERRATPVEEKESHRWVQMLRRAGEVAERCPDTRITCVADSEADMYEFLVEGTSETFRADWIVRAGQNRALAEGQETAEKYVRERVEAQPVLFTNTIQVRGRKAKIACDKGHRRQPRESREAEVEVRAARVTLRPPQRSDRKLPEVTVNVVQVREIDPPKNDEPVEWLLLTSLRIDDAASVQKVIQTYAVRWMIEILFRVLKSGCRAEERRFEHIDRMLPCLAVYLIVAWRTLYVCRLGRSCPDIDCEAVFEPAEWKSVWKVVRKSDPPPHPPPLGEMVRLVAQLGGYVNKKRPDPPGPQTIWIGLQRMHDFAACWVLFGPGSREPAEDV
jgi:hypothetical protein